MEINLKSLIMKKLVSLKNESSSFFKENKFGNSALLYNDIGEYEIYTPNCEESSEHFKQFTKNALKNFPVFNYVSTQFINTFRTIGRNYSFNLFNDKNRNSSPLNNSLGYTSNHGYVNNMKLSNSTCLPSVASPELNKCGVSNREIDAYISRISAIENEIKALESKDNHNNNHHHHHMHSACDWKSISRDGSFQVYEHRFTPSKISHHNDESVIYFEKSDIEQSEYFITGSINDITLDDLAFVYYEIEIRKLWDKYVKKIDIIHRDDNSNSDIVNWIITNFLPFRPPYQYIFARRLEHKNETKTCYILCRSILDPKEFPILSSLITPAIPYIGKYKSLLKLEATEDINKNGVMFSMLYYEEKGAEDYQYPSFVAAQVVSSMVKSLYSAAKTHGSKNPNHL